MDILDDMLAGVGWTMQDYLKYGENDYYPPLPNGHRLFLHDIRRVAVRAAVAMGEDGDMVVCFANLNHLQLEDAFRRHILSFLFAYLKRLFISRRWLLVKAMRHIT